MLRWLAQNSISQFDMKRFIGDSKSQSGKAIFLIDVQTRSEQKSRGGFGGEREKKYIKGESETVQEQNRSLKGLSGKIKTEL